MLAYCSSTKHEENCKYPMEEGYALFINNDEISNIYNKNPPENGGFVSSLNPTLVGRIFILVEARCTLRLLLIPNTIIQ